MEAEAAEELAAWLVDECERILENAKSGSDIRLANHALLTLARFGGFVACGPNPALLAYDWILRVHANELAAAARATARLRCCGARRKRDGQPCLAKPLQNGCCKLHGGMSTGPKTAEGRMKATANLRQNRINAAAPNAESANPEPHHTRAR
ncbi:MAG TPA: HGGxSTG domain-containing protein [Alphaproteobacteria bacterium]|nr:HGGxSTG domain-containing protein [Alphaproteobacteria bacterium]